MIHVRTQIRAAFAARLTGLATAGTNVHARRTLPPTDVLPLMLVYLGDEAGELISVTSDRVEQRQADLVITVVCKDGGDIEDTLDQIALEVQQAIATAPDLSFGGLIKDIGAPRIEADIDDALEKPAGLNRIIYPVTYFIAGTNPAVAL